MAIANALFDLRDPALSTRVLEAGSKILKRRVSQLTRLHWRDGGEIMRQLEQSAVKRGVWTPEIAKDDKANPRQTN